MTLGIWQCKCKVIYSRVFENHIKEVNLRVMKKYDNIDGTLGLNEEEIE